MLNKYKISEFAERVGRAADTVRRWEREGKLTAKRLPSGQRYFDESDVRALMGGAPDKKDDLALQVAAMESSCLAGAIPVDVWIQEIGGGVNGTPLVIVRDYMNTLGKTKINPSGSPT